MDYLRMNFVKIEYLFYYKIMLIAPYIETEIFGGIQSSWRKMLLSPKIKPILNACFDALDADLRSKGVTPELIQKNGLATYIRPKPSQIFEAFKYFDINNLKVIIMGQDPYPNPNHACGLSFSVPPGSKPSASLKKIYSCLVYSNLMDEDLIPIHGCLINWAKQGVLLLNKFLTRTPNICSTESGDIWINGNGGSDKKNLHVFWGDLTREILMFISNVFMFKYVNHPRHLISIMLWGQKARSMSSFICQDPTPLNGTTMVLEWGHPSPMSRVNQDKSSTENFTYCDGFTQVNEALRLSGFTEIQWNPDIAIDETIDLKDQFYSLRMLGGTPHARIDAMVTKGIRGSLFLYVDNSNSKENVRIRELLTNGPPKNALKTTLEAKSPVKIVCFTDGGCTNNGYKGAKASYGVYFPKIWQETQNPIYENLSGIVPSKTLDFDLKTLKIFERGIKTPPTNNRGEMLAIIYALMRIIRESRETRVTHPVLVVTDSMLMINTITQWITRWQAHKFKGRKNIDLLKILWTLLQELDSFPDMVHQRSHLTKKDIPEGRGTTGSYEYEKWLGNEEADKLCNLVLS